MHMTRTIYKIAKTPKAMKLWRTPRFLAVLKGNIIIVDSKIMAIRSVSLSIKRWKSKLCNIEMINLDSVIK